MTGLKSKSTVLNKLWAFLFGDRLVNIGFDRDGNLRALFKFQIIASLVFQTVFNANIFVEMVRILDFYFRLLRRIGDRRFDYFLTAPGFVIFEFSVISRPPTTYLF